MGSLEDLAELDARKARDLLREELSEEERVEDILEREAKGWRYAPFFVTDYGEMGERECVDVPEKANTTKTDGEEEREFSSFFLLLMGPIILLTRLLLFSQPLWKHQTFTSTGRSVSLRCRLSGSPSFVPLSLSFHLLLQSDG